MKLGKLLSEKKGKIITVRENKSFLDAIKLMNKHKIGSLLVLDKNKKLVGILSERDILWNFEKLKSGKKDIHVEDLMTKNMIIGLPDDYVEYSMGIMTKNKIRHLPVMDDGELVGLVSIGDLINSMLKHAEFQNRYLEQYIQGGYY